MDQHNNKNNLVIWEYLIPGGLLFLSYWLLNFLPQYESWKFWVVFVISVFLFCVGYFVLLESLPQEKSQTGLVTRNLILMVFGMGMFFFGLYYVYIDNGGTRSLAAATLLLIESLVMCGAVGSSVTETSQLPRTLFWVIIIGMAVAGIWFFVQEITSETQESYGRIEVATLLWIAAAAWWQSLPVVEDSKDYKRKKKNSSGN